MLTPISPQEAESMLQSGALMCDIREPGEFVQERIDGSRNVPLSQLSGSIDAGGDLIFCCLSGARTAMNEGRLANTAGRRAYVLAGGLSAWKRAGLPVTRG